MTERETILKARKTIDSVEQPLYLYDLFRDQVGRTPGAPAVASGGSELTYRELDDAADRLAQELQATGASPGSLVGLCVERSLDLIVGLLAVVKVGAAYVPLDPLYPVERLKYMLADANADLLLTQRDLATKFRDYGGRSILVDAAYGSGRNGDGPRADTLPDSLAYVRYTSGSTGRPKGVAVPRRALLNFLVSMQKRPGMTSRDVLLAVSPFSFDISELEIWLPLISGGKLVLAQRDQCPDGEALSELITRHEVTLMQGTPATWRLLIDSGWSGDGRLKALCGGEAVGSDLVEDLLQRCREVWNMYGPTETTVWSTCARLLSSDDIHIGRPIDATEVYVLDGYLQPVPIGVTGELFIGGTGLARGYLNRPELTAQSFVPHPFSSGERLYRTGDFVKYRSDGNLVCLGRLDGQVKLRGYRIELGEIEAALNKIAGIKQAVADVRNDQLVAYCVTEAGSEIDPSSCREALRTWLPEYMIPGLYVRLETIPLTANGKVDRKALPEPSSSATSASARYSAPRTETEARLVAIWEALLERSPVGVHDDFFELGGHSLIAVRLFSRIEDEFGRRLPLASLFKEPTIARLAALLEAPDADIRPHERWGSLVSIRDGGGPAVFLVHGAGGNILLYRDLVRNLLPGVAIYGLQSPGLDGHEPPVRTVQQMAAVYVSEITRRSPGPYVLAGYCMGGKVALEMARLLEERGQPVAMLGLLDAFNLNVANADLYQVGRLSQVKQLFSFHLGNLARLGVTDAWPYVSEKARLAREAALGWLSSAYRKLRVRWNSDDSEERGVEEFIQSVNDRAGFNYVPEVYAGPATLFRPIRNYTEFRDPQSGWGDVIQGQLELVELDMNPHAMLVEPFVRELAAEINARLQHAFPELGESESVQPVHSRGGLGPPWKSRKEAS